MQKISFAYLEKTIILSHPYLTKNAFHTLQKGSIFGLLFDLLPCPFTGPKMFCASLSIHSVKLVFVPTLNRVKSCDWLKKFELAQKILVPVKGRGISQFIIEIKEHKQFGSS